MIIQREWLKLITRFSPLRYTHFSHQSIASTVKFDHTIAFLSLSTLNSNLQIKLDSQYYFYMETQTALAIPDEDNCMVVYTSSQCPEYAHRVIAQCLGVPEHNVRVLTKRVGGGFGGKAIRAMPVSISCLRISILLHLPLGFFFLHLY